MTTRFIPALGVVANGLAFGLHIAGAASKHDGLLAVAALGDAIAVFGNVVSAIPGGVIPGEILSTLGIGVSGLFEGIDNLVSGDAQKDEVRKILNAVRDSNGISMFSSDFVEQLLKSTPERILQLKQIGLDTPALQALSGQYPDLLDNNLLNVTRFKGLVDAFRLQPESVQSLLETLADKPNAREALAVVFQNLPATGSSQADYEKALQTLIDNESSEDPNFAPAARDRRGRAASAGKIHPATRPRPGGPLPV